MADYWRTELRCAMSKATPGEYTEHPNPNTVGIDWAWAVSEPGKVHSGKLDGPAEQEVPHKDEADRVATAFDVDPERHLALEAEE
jgi:hypothetical protein